MYVYILCNCSLPNSLLFSFLPEPLALEQELFLSIEFTILILFPKVEVRLFVGEMPPGRFAPIKVTLICFLALTMS